MTYSINIIVRQEIAVNTKLTLRLDEELIDEAKDYAKKEGKSLSRLVAEFFTAISAKKSHFDKSKLRPVTSKLYGSLKDQDISKEDYKKHIEKKYL
jgi:antitoxin component of RelBE/YafQ-DinJ toxin-antitoxin module